MRFCPARTHTASVVRDWRTPLGSVKSAAYVVCVGRLENAYSMFSVNLDEAIGLRRYGRTCKAHQVLSVAPALCQRLARPLQSLLRAMLEHAKHFGTTPNLAPLDPENFQNSRSQRVARFNDLLSNILLTRKSRFLHKISALGDLVDNLDTSFESTVEELAGQESLQPELDWELLDVVHYDLNTCLREAVVLFKSFLHALPDAQLASFQGALKAPSDTLTGLVVARSRHLAHRRMTFLKGQ